MKFHPLLTEDDRQFLQKEIVFDTVLHRILIEKLAANAWMSAWSAGSRTGGMDGPREWWSMELNPAGDQSQVVFLRAWC